MPCLVKRWVKYRRKTLPTVRYNIDIVEEKKNGLVKLALEKLCAQIKASCQASTALQTVGLKPELPFCLPCFWWLG